jgi:histidinol-phosphate aminotransferase
VTDLIRLASNENPLGPSPRVLATLRLSDLHRYGDPDGRQLREKLARKHGLSAAGVVIGAGSSALLKLMADAYLRPGDDALTSDICFPVYQHVIQTAGARAVTVPLDDNLDYDLEQMLQAWTVRTKTVFLASPNNPTGKKIRFSELVSFLGRLPRSTLCILDVAYWEYADAGADETPAQLLAAHRNLVVVGTFSKVYGLAGLRVGYALADPEIIQRLDQVRIPFGTSSVALHAACTALEDSDHVARSVATNRTSMAILVGELKRRKALWWPSDANFLLADFGIDSDILSQRLLQHGVMVQPMRHPRLRNCLRITIGTARQMQALQAALRASMPMPKRGRGRDVDVGLKASGRHNGVETDRVLGTGAAG